MLFRILSRPWFFVLMGVVMTILSAVITNYFIVQNNDALEKTELKLFRLSMKIDQTWQESVALEQLEEVGTTLLLIAETSREGNVNVNSSVRLSVARYIEKVIRLGAVDPATSKRLRELIEQGKHRDVLQSLFAVIDSHKVTTVNAINDLYIEKADYERQSAGIKERNATLSIIALFLHIMGLILVLTNSLIQKVGLPEDF